MNSELIERLETAEGPDRELANDVLLACGWSIDERGADPTTPYLVWNPPDGGDDFRDGDQPDPTASIDAALTLVPEGWQWQISNRAPAPHYGRAYLHNNQLQFANHLRPNPKYRGEETTAATPVLALCITALRARITVAKAACSGVGRMG